MASVRRTSPCQVDLRPAIAAAARMATTDQRALSVRVHCSLSLSRSSGTFVSSQRHQRARIVILAHRLLPGLRDRPLDQRQGQAAGPPRRSRLQVRIHTFPRSCSLNGVARSRARDALMLYAGSVPPARGV
jgi:hypothetical protein